MKAMGFFISINPKHTDIFREGNTNPQKFHTSDTMIINTFYATSSRIMYLHIFLIPTHTYFMKEDILYILQN